MIRRYSIFAAIALAVMVSSATVFADFDYRGRVANTIDGERIFDGEDFALLPSSSDKACDVIDWRCTSAVSPLDHSVTLTSVEKKFSVKSGVMLVEGGFKITYDFTINASLSDGNELTISLKIPKTLFAFIPEDGARAIAEFDTDGKACVAGTYRYNFDVSESDIAFQSGAITDFRGVGWYDDFRMDLRTEPLSVATGRIVLKVTRCFNANIGASDSPFMLLPLADAFTRPLIDEVENDGKGGWTDQGTNDMSSLKAGVIQAQGIPFAIGDGAIILRGSARPSFPLESSVIPVNARVERLAFCHTAGWCTAMSPGFYYRVIYEDDSQIDVPVYGGLDVSDWAGLLAVSARVRCAWKGANNEHAVNLAHFQWKNPKPELTIKSVQVVSADIATVPIVLAITAVRADRADDTFIKALNTEYAKENDDTVNLPVEKPDWYESGIDASKTILSGSALDVSAINHKPAGKFGFVKRVGDHFEFEHRPGERVAFWGTCVQAAGPEKKFAPVIADRLAKSGVNIVRIHHWMIPFSHPACPVETERSFIRPDHTVNMERLDDLYYFIAELKKAGIYIYMDNITSYNSSWVDGGDELHYRPDANARIKEVVKLVLTTVNPYTGLALVDDTAFAMCEIHNEFSATYQHTVETHSPVAQKLMKEWWEQWQNDHNITPHTELTGTPADGNGEEGRRFYTAIQQRFLEDWYSYLRSIGVKVPISGTNLLLTAGDLIASQNMDFMEDHAYYGSGPVAGIGVWQPMNVSMVGEPLTGNSMIGEIVHSRVTDKPIVCTEWSDVYPNQMRCEGYPYVGAFSAYQQFDAMFSFDWAGAYTDNISSLLNNKPIVCLSQISDPSTWGLNVAAAVAFLRGDVTPAQNRVELKYTWEDIWQNRRQNSMAVAYLLQMARLSITRPDANTTGPSWPYGTGLDHEALFQDAVQRLGIDAGRDYIISDTKELRRFSEPALFILDTPRSQFATGALNSIGSDARRRLSAFDVMSSMKFATITFTSLDGAALSDSTRILLCAVGNSANSTSSIDASGYHESGELPILTEPFYATISATPVVSKSLKVFRLDQSTGKRVGELQVVLRDGKESFVIDQNTRTMYLELVRE